MITLNFDEVLKRIYNAKKGVEVRYGLGQGFEYCKQFADEAQGHATNAKASADKAAQTVAGIEQTKTDAVQAVQNAQTGAVKAVDNERDAALQQVSNSTQAAETAANAAGNAATAAGGYASSAESSATAASGSASAAATSESNAASSAQSAGTDADRAEAAAALAGTRANTDKTLKTENAPADAKATGDALADKADKSTVQDESGNAIFYSKTEVEAKIKEMIAAQREEDHAKIKFWVSPDPTSPAELFGGTWERIEGKFIMGASNTYPAGSTGGNLQTMLSPENIPAVGFAIPTSDTQKNDIHVNKWDFIVSVSQETTDGGKFHSGLYSSTNNGNSPVGILNPYYSMYIWRRVA